MKAHRLSLKEAALPTMELELTDGTIIHVLPGSPSQLQELKTIKDKILKENTKDNTDLSNYIRLTFQFLSELLSHNREGLYMTANDLRNKYLKLEVDPNSANREEDVQQNEMLVIATVIRSYTEFLFDIHGQKNL